MYICFHTVHLIPAKVFQPLLWLHKRVHYVWEIFVIVAAFRESLGLGLLVFLDQPLEQGHPIRPSVSGSLLQGSFGLRRLPALGRDDPRALSEQLLLNTTNTEVDAQMPLCLFEETEPFLEKCRFWLFALTDKTCAFHSI